MATCPPYPTNPPRPHWWQRGWVRYGALTTLLAISGLVILALVREQTGTQGFLVGLGLAVLPVPLLMAAFRWLDRVEPGPWRNLVFCFAWGACAAALIAIIANSFATRWIATATADPAGADTLGATVIAPVVEESAKAAAVLLVFLFRRRDFTGIVDGVVTAGVTATGFAFTENILYLGNAFGTDQLTGDSGFASVTAATFFVRVVMSPFAHPLFTVLTGIGFGIAALSTGRHHLRRALLPLAGLLLAMGMHALWNGSAAFGEYGFLAVYGAFMVPCFGLLTWLVIWTRSANCAPCARSFPPTSWPAGWHRRSRTRSPRCTPAASPGSTPAGTPGSRRRGRWRSTRRTRPHWRSCGSGGARAGGPRLRRTGAGVAGRAVAPPRCGPPGAGPRGTGDGPTARRPLAGVRDARLPRRVRVRVRVRIRGGRLRRIRVRGPARRIRTRGPVRRVRPRPPGSRGPGVHPGLGTGALPRSRP